MDQIQTIQENVIKQNLNDKEETIRKLMEQDVEHEFKEKEFKQALQSTMNEIAIRLMQQYRSQKNSGLRIVFQILVFTPNIIPISFKNTFIS